MSTPKVKDVAERAGVSTATVSRVLNNDSRVRPILQQRVWQAVSELDYLPDYTARNLRARKARNIGLIVPDIQNAFFTSLARGIEDEAYAHGYRVTLCNSDEDLEKEQAYMQVLYAERMSGVIVCPASENETSCSVLLRSETPVVSVDRLLPHPAIDSVLIDNIYGAKLAMQHLIGLGHTRIAMITGKLTVNTGRERLEGYYQAMAEAGIEVDPSLVISGDFMFESGYTAMCQLLDQELPPTAVFISNNRMTLGALNAIQERNVCVPEKLSVVCFDDEVWANLTNPPLTTIVQPTYELGRSAADLILQKVRSREETNNSSAPLAPAEPRRVILRPELRVRQSTAPVSNTLLIKPGGSPEAIR